MHVIKEMLTTFDVLYKRKIGARYPINGGKDSKLVKDLLAMYSPMEIEAFMAAYFTMEDPFFREAGYSLGCFRACLPKVIRHCHEKLEKAKAAPISAVLPMLADPTWRPSVDCIHGRGCYTRATCEAYERNRERTA